jgi:Cu(I)/Ag(I) efflux system membrane protein CusA/SilA
MPGYQMSISPPIRTRIDMLTTGVRTPVGIKVFGADLGEIERLSIELEGLLRQVPGTRSTFAERQTGREYIDVVPDREAIARYGLTVRDVHDVVEAAIGGMPVSTVIAGRSRFSINLRYAAEYRADPEALRSILIPVPISESIAGMDPTGSGAGTSAPVGAMQGGASPSSASSGSMGGMGAMGGGAASRGMQMGSGQATASPQMGGGSGFAADASERWRQPGATVPLGVVAEISVVTGPPMIKDENGLLVGYVFADIDSSERDLGGWVRDAKALVREQVTLPAGSRIEWTGQYEFMAEMEERMKYVLPLTLALIVVLLFLSMKGWPQTFLVLMSLPFAIAGSVWLLAALGYNLSTAVWVGLIAVGGVAAQTGIIIVVYLDEAFQRALSEGRVKKPEDVDAVVVEGASRNARPMVMTVATTVLGLMPLLWASGAGADIAARTAAPVVGGLWSCMFLTLLVIPAGYTIWRRRQVRLGGAAVPAAEGSAQ